MPMTEREHLDQKALEFSEGLWRRDVWEFDSSEFERARWARLIDILGDARYPRALELGCGAGHFTRLLAGLADRVVAFDIAPSAIERARAAEPASTTIDYRAGNVMDCQWRADGPWDLVVMTETIPYLGWLYPFFDVAWFAAEIHGATRPGGRFLMANSMDETYDKLLLPYILRTYRDLFRNVGFELVREEVFPGTKHGVRFEVLISLFAKPPGA
jgi:2-polyprenyl-3-methyl-5-hydroxy-6-metoxy-1,4-benzoquinol methylase